MWTDVHVFDTYQMTLRTLLIRSTEVGSSHTPSSVAGTGGSCAELELIASEPSTEVASTGAEGKAGRKTRRQGCHTHGLDGLVGGGGKWQGQWSSWCPS